MENQNTENQKPKSFRPYIYSGLVIVAAVIFVVWFSGRKGSGVTNAAAENLAACLAYKKITMYGAYWCPHCQNEKSGFGDAWKLVPYVECTQETKLCLEKKINGYPTWLWPDGKRLEGEQGLENLSQESGCSLSK